MAVTVRPPVAREAQHETALHGEVRVDPYYWLRDRSNPDVLAYLDAENAYVEQVLGHTRELQERLYGEMRGRIKETDEQVPERVGDYFYYSRTEEGKQYPIFLRKQGSLDAPEEVLLDQNALAEGESYCRLGAFEVSPDHSLLAYSLDTSGAESYTLYVKDLATGELLPDRVPNTYYGVEWANDNRTIFYNVLDEAMRPYKLFRHTVGSDPSEDALVYHEQDEAFFLSISKTRSKKFLLITLESHMTTEVRYAPADEPGDEFRVIHPRQHGMEYAVHHHGDRFLIVTNDDAKNFRLMETPVATPSKEFWRDLIPHRPGVLLDGMDAFAGHLAIYERENGLQRIRITGPRGEEPRYVEFPEPVYTYKAGPNEEFEKSVLRFTYASLVTPNSVVDYDMQAGTWELRKQDEIPSGYDPELYRSERTMATAPDGTQVPVSLVYPKDAARDGRSPLLLYGYGSYGYSIDPGFASSRLSLLERGFVFAIAHIRGGSELGRGWYEQGKLLRKKNTFTDFIACAEHLIAQGYTSPDRLAIMGASAGGLLMGAVTNARPELFKAVVAKVPFVDVINTMTDPSLPLTVTEWEEWGDPLHDRRYFEYMLSYSPYDNVERKGYPHMLLTAGLNDPRVSYWEPAKLTAKLRATKTDGNLLLLKTDTESGHGGPSGRYDYLKEIAFEYAFLLEVLGVENEGG
jgi:oligopeptidase B